MTNADFIKVLEARKENKKKLIKLLEETPESEMKEFTRKSLKLIGGLPTFVEETYLSTDEIEKLKAIDVIASLETNANYGAFSNKGPQSK